VGSIGWRQPGQPGETSFAVLTEVLPFTGFSFVMSSAVD
jgi:hypothetical protein